MLDSWYWRGVLSPISKTYHQRISLRRLVSSVCHQHQCYIGDVSLISKGLGWIWWGFEFLELLPKRKHNNFLGWKCPKNKIGTIDFALSWTDDVKSGYEDHERQKLDQCTLNLSNLNGARNDVGSVQIRSLDRRYLNNFQKKNRIYLNNNIMTGV